MPVQLSNRLEKSPAMNGETILGDLISHQFLNSYITGIQASEQKEPELASMMAHNIFDLLDWVRKNQRGAQINLSGSADVIKRISSYADELPSSLHELELLVDIQFFPNSSSVAATPVTAG